VAVATRYGRACPGHTDNPRTVLCPHPTLPRLRGRVGWGQDKPGDDERMATSFGRVSRIDVVRAAAAPRERTV